LVPNFFVLSKWTTYFWTDTKTTTKSNAKRYEQQWDVPSGSDLSSYYTVSLTQEQQLICSCWPFLRNRTKPCKHIKRVQRGELSPRGQPMVAPPMQSPAVSTPVAPDEPSISLPIAQFSQEYGDQYSSSLLENTGS
jgi:hypothetical protein